MRLKLDENLGATWINGLRDRGHGVDTVSDEGMGGAFDADVLAAAAGASRAAHNPGAEPSRIAKRADVG